MSAEFDAVARWDELRKRLDTRPMEALCDLLLLNTRKVRGIVGPTVCPRHECRSPEIGRQNDGWNCWICGAFGHGAGLVAAHVCGWLDANPGADAVRSEFVKLAQATVFNNLLDLDAEQLAAWLYSIPNSEEWTEEQRGVFVGDERMQRAKALVMTLARAHFPADAISRLSIGWSMTFCRPPLTRDELSNAISEAAEAVG